MIFPELLDNNRGCCCPLRVRDFYGEWVRDEFNPGFFVCLPGAFGFICVFAAGT